MQTKYKHTTWIVYVRSVAIANATNTTTTSLLLFLLSVQFLNLCSGFQPLGGGGPLTLFSNLHLVLNEYFPRDFVLFTFVLLIIFLYAKSSFIFSQFLFTHSSLYFFVSEHFSNMCLPSSAPKHRDHLPLSKPLPYIEV
jgi:hypothetical protein